MEHIAATAEKIALPAFLALDEASLHTIYHAECDRMVDAELHTQLFDITEPVMDYFIDGIDEAADDEEQTNLRTLVAKAIMAMQRALMVSDVDQAQA